MVSTENIERDGKRREIKKQKERRAKKRVDREVGAERVRKRGERKKLI